MLYSCPEYDCYRTDNSLPMLAKTDSPKKYSSLLLPSYNIPIKSKCTKKCSNKYTIQHESQIHC